MWAEYTKMKGIAMIFVTLGSQKFQFNRLLKKLDELVERKIITEKIYAQIGASDYVPKHYEYKDFLNRNEFEDKTRECDLFITHGGTGAIIGAVKKGKKVIAVPRLAKYGEHVDDHQLQLLEQFQDMNIIETCVDLDELEDKYNSIQDIQMVPYVSNTQSVIDSIIKYIESES